jgi:hypothetical protein
VWAVSLSGNPFKSVGLDEANEMLINRDLKMSLSRPPEPASHLLKTNTLNYRSLTLKNLNKQLELGLQNNKDQEASHNFEPHKHSERHIQNAKEMILSSKLSLESVSGEDHLVHVFTGENASPQSKLDFLSFRKIGERLLLRFITHSILRIPSTQQRPEKKQYLQGFQTVKAKSKKAKNTEKEMAKQRQLYWKKVIEAERKKRPFETILTVTNPILEAVFHANPT